MYLFQTFSQLVLVQYMQSFQPLIIFLRNTIGHRFVPKCKSSVSTYYVPGSLQTQTFTAPLQSLQFFCTLLLNFQNDKICLCCCVHLSFLTVFKERPFKVSVETNLPFTSKRQLQLKQFVAKVSKFPNTEAQKFNLFYYFVRSKFGYK